MRTLREHLSNSEIFRGNHSTSSSSVGNSAGSTVLARRPCLSLCDIRQTAKAHNKQEKRKSPLPSSSVQMLSGGSRVTMVVWNFSNWMSSLNSVLPHSQSTKISTSELLRRDLLDSMWTMLTCFSCGNMRDMSESHSGHGEWDVSHVWLSRSEVSSTYKGGKATLCWEFSQLLFWIIRKTSCHASM